MKKHVFKFTRDVSLEKALKLSNSKTVWVKFVKKNGDIREMFAKTKIKRFLKNKKQHQVNRRNIIVYDVVSRGYRSFDPNSVLEFRCGSTILRFDHKQL